MTGFQKFTVLKRQNVSSDVTSPVILELEGFDPETGERHVFVPNEPVRVRNPLVKIPPDQVFWIDEIFGGDLTGRVLCAMLRFQDPVTGESIFTIVGVEQLQPLPVMLRIAYESLD